MTLSLAYDDPSPREIVKQFEYHRQPHLTCSLDFVTLFLNYLERHPTFKMGLPLKLGVPKVPDDSPAQSQTSQPVETQHQQPSLATGAGVNTGAGTTRPKTEAELEADRLYEEAMEEEYAKRDGGS